MTRYQDPPETTQSMAEELTAHFGHLRLVFMWPICPQLPHFLCQSGTKHQTHGSLKLQVGSETYRRLVLDLLSPWQEDITCTSLLCILALQTTLLVLAELLEMLGKPVPKTLTHQQLCPAEVMHLLEPVTYFFLTTSSCSGSPVRTRDSGSCSSSASIACLCRKYPLITP